eukprot:scaffold6924_cov94-Skeletonema_marinoi.AAC.3
MMGHLQVSIALFTVVGATRWLTVIPPCGHPKFDLIRASMRLYNSVADTATKSTSSENLLLKCRNPINGPIEDVDCSIHSV